MIPGLNLLDVALSVIQPQQLTYYQATGRTENAVRQYATTYAAPATIYGSFQPVSRALYQVYNLDLQKSYFVLYTSSNVIDIERDLSADQISYAGKRYQCLSDQPDWLVQDGWKGVLCVFSGASG